MGLDVAGAGVGDEIGPSVGDGVGAGDGSAGGNARRLGADGVRGVPPAKVLPAAEVA